MDKFQLLSNYYWEFKQNSSFMEDYVYLRSWDLKEENRKRISSKGWDYINSKVHEAIHLYGIYDLTQELMVEAIYNGLRNYYWNHNSKINHWYKRIKSRHSKSNHYVRKNHHTKKELSDKEIAKKDWKEKKGKNKDNQKCGYSRRRAGKYFKKLSNKMHRSWQKEMMYNEDYDNMHGIDYKFFQDPWMWD